MGRSLTEVFAEQEALLKAEPERTAGLTLTFQFDLDGDDGGIWHLTITNGEPSIRPGPAHNPDLTLMLSVEDYVSMNEGLVAGRDLFFSGRMQLEGNALLGMVLGRVMGSGSNPDRITLP
jgi:putative sterol carrier protein